MTLRDKILGTVVALGIALGASGCSTKYETLYDGGTSLGQTKVIKVNRRFFGDGRKVVITKGDNTLIFYKLFNAKNSTSL